MYVGGCRSRFKAWDFASTFQLGKWWYTSTCVVLLRTALRRSLHEVCPTSQSRRTRLVPSAASCIWRAPAQHKHIPDCGQQRLRLCRLRCYGSRCLAPMHCRWPWPAPSQHIEEHGAARLTRSLLMRLIDFAARTWWRVRLMPSASNAVCRPVADVARGSACSACVPPASPLCAAISALRSPILPGTPHVMKVHALTLANAWAAERQAGSTQSPDDHSC